MYGSEQQSEMRTEEMNGILEYVKRHFHGIIPLY